MCVCVYVCVCVCLYSMYSGFLVINVCNKGKTLCSPCIIFVQRCEVCSYTIPGKATVYSHTTCWKTEQ